LIGGVNNTAVLINDSLFSGTAVALLLYPVPVLKNLEFERLWLPLKEKSIKKHM
jgi:hypothetical protein